eukprot:434203-Alexandrium_andersonii.AAC.1
MQLSAVITSDFLVRRSGRCPRTPHAVLRPRFRRPLRAALRLRVPGHPHAALRPRGRRPHRS